MSSVEVPENLYDKLPKGDKRSDDFIPIQAAQGVNFLIFYPNIEIVNFVSYSWIWKRSQDYVVKYVAKTLGNGLHKESMIFKKLYFPLYFCYLLFYFPSFPT